MSKANLKFLEHNSVFWSGPTYPGGVGVVTILPMTLLSADELRGSEDVKLWFLISPIQKPASDPRQDFVGVAKGKLLSDYRIVIDSPITMLAREGALNVHLMGANLNTIQTGSDRHPEPNSGASSIAEYNLISIENFNETEDFGGVSLALKIDEDKGTADQTQTLHEKLKKKGEDLIGFEQVSNNNPVVALSKFISWEHQSTAVAPTELWVNGQEHLFDAKLSVLATTIAPTDAKPRFPLCAGPHLDKLQTVAFDLSFTGLESVTPHVNGHSSASDFTQMLAELKVTFFLRNRNFAIWKRKSSRGLEPGGAFAQRRLVEYWDEFQELCLYLAFRAVRNHRPYSRQFRVLSKIRFNPGLAHLLQPLQADTQGFSALLAWIRVLIQKLKFFSTLKKTLDVGDDLTDEQKRLAAETQIFTHHIVDFLTAAPQYQKDRAAHEFLVNSIAAMFESKRQADGTRTIRCGGFHLSPTDLAMVSSPSFKDRELSVRGYKPQFQNAELNFEHALFQLHPWGFALHSSYLESFNAYADPDNLEKLIEISEKSNPTARQQRDSKVLLLQTYLNALDGGGAIKLVDQELTVAGVAMAKRLSEPGSNEILLSKKYLPVLRLLSDQFKSNDLFGSSNEEILYNAGNPEINPFKAFLKHHQIPNLEILEESAFSPERTARTYLSWIENPIEIKDIEDAFEQIGRTGSFSVVGVLDHPRLVNVILALCQQLPRMSIIEYAKLKDPFKSKDFDGHIDDENGLKKNPEIAKFLLNPASESALEDLSSALEEASISVEISQRIEEELTNFLSDVKNLCELDYSISTDAGGPQSRNFPSNMKPPSKFVSEYFGPKFKTNYAVSLAHLSPYAEELTWRLLQSERRGLEQEFARSDHEIADEPHPFIYFLEKLSPPFGTGEMEVLFKKLSNQETSKARKADFFKHNSRRDLSEEDERLWKLLDEAFETRLRPVIQGIFDLRTSRERDAFLEYMKSGTTNP